MRASFIYRVVAGLLVLFALGHTLGFSRVDPGWGVALPLAALKAIHFTVQGTPGRTYWGFFLGFGYFCSALMLLSAALAWQLGRVPSDVLRRLQVISWAFAAAFLLSTCITWVFFFTAPRVFSILITIGLLAGAWLAGRPARAGA